MCKLIRRLLSQEPKNEIVLVPDVPAATLVGWVEDTFPFVLPDQLLQAWDFYHDRQGQLICGRGLRFEAFVWKPGERVTFELARRHLEEMGYTGHVGAFLAWLLRNHPRGEVATMPSDDMCWIHPSGQSYVPCYNYGSYGYYDEASHSWGLNWIGSEHPPMSFVGFREVAR